MQTKFLSENLKGKDLMQEPGIDGKIILKYIDLKEIRCKDMD